MKFLPILVILTTIVVIGINGNIAYAEPGNTDITLTAVQGGVGFDVIDPDGIKSVELTSPNSQLMNVNADCSDPQITNTNVFFNLATGGGVNLFDITDCQSPRSTSTWTITTAGVDPPNPANTVECTVNCFRITVGGEFIGIDSTPLILAGGQMTAAWILPVIVAGAGFAIVIARKF